METTEIQEEKIVETDLYSESEAYWNSVEPSVDGMLGGFAVVSNPDVSESKRFLKALRPKVR